MEYPFLPHGHDHGLRCRYLPLRLAPRLPVAPLILRTPITTSDGPKIRPSAHIRLPCHEGPRSRLEAFGPCRTNPDATHLRVWRTSCHLVASHMASGRRYTDPDIISCVVQWVTIQCTTHCTTSSSVRPSIHNWSLISQRRITPLQFKKVHQSSAKFEFAKLNYRNPSSVET